MNLAIRGGKKVELEGKNRLKSVVPTVVELSVAVECESNTTQPNYILECGSGVRVQYYATKLYY